VFLISIHGFEVQPLESVFLKLVVSFLQVQDRAYSKILYFDFEFKEILKKL